MSTTKTNAAPIVLVPGFWLGAWAWDEVASALQADGHDVTALTLPGLEALDADRSEITHSDHVDAICEAVTARPEPFSDSRGAMLPTMVTSSPSRIHTVPSPMTMVQCQRDQGSRSRRAGMAVSSIGIVSDREGE